MSTWRSNSENALTRCSKSLPCGVVVSNGSVTLTKSIPSAVSSSRVLTMCRSNQLSAEAWQRFLEIGVEADLAR
ncbi:MAG: hypothetical protein ACOC1F_03025 [Myxococcota bacterium]